MFDKKLYNRIYGKKYRKLHKNEIKIYAKEQHKKHKERNNLRSLAYHYNHKAERNAYKKTYYINNREHCLDYSKKYNKLHKDQVRMYRNKHRTTIKYKETTSKWLKSSSGKESRKRTSQSMGFKKNMKRYQLSPLGRKTITTWRNSPKGRICLKKYKHNHRLLTKDLTIAIVQQVYEDNIKQYGSLTCYLCLRPIKFGKDALEHKIPLSRGGTNLRENLDIACMSCNSRKHNKTLEEYRCSPPFHYFEVSG